MLSGLANQPDRGVGQRLPRTLMVSTLIVVNGVVRVNGRGVAGVTLLKGLIGFI